LEVSFDGMLWHRWHPETCLDHSDFATLIRDPIRQAIAETIIGAACPQVSMAPVLAITGMVAGTTNRESFDRRWSSSSIFCRRWVTITSL
jgi:hypothetical protein